MSALPPSRTSRVRHVLLTCSLVLAPVLIAVGGFMSMNVDWEDRADVVATAAGQPAFWQTQQLLTMFGFMLLVPAAIAAAELIRGRSPALALASVVLLGAGAMVIVGAVVHEWTFAAAEGLDTAVIAEYDTQVDELGGIVVIFPLFFAGLFGMLTLAVGLWRSKATPIWVPALLAVSIAATFFVDPGIYSSVAEVGLAVAFLGIAWYFWQARETPAPIAVSKRQVESEPPPVVTATG
jgi:hypothetical protein